MNKVLLAFAVMLCMGVYALAETVDSPKANVDQALATAEYGGTYKDTNNLTTAAKLAFSGEGVLQAVILSTGAAGDYVEFRDTDTANTSSGIFLRVYVDTTAANETARELKYPIRVTNGLSYNVSTPMNSVSVLYWKEQ